MKFILRRSSGDYFTRFTTGAACFGGDTETAYRFQSREEYEQQLAREPHLAGELEEIDE